MGEGGEEGRREGGGGRGVLQAVLSSVWRKKNKHRTNRPSSQLENVRRKKNKDRPKQPSSQLGKRAFRLAKLPVCPPVTEGQGGGIGVLQAVLFGWGKAQGEGRGGGGD